MERVALNMLVCSLGVSWALVLFLLHVAFS